MFDMTISGAAAACGGSLNDSRFASGELTGIVIDSRKAAPGMLFVAYRGENTDGHKYIASAFANGAACALAEYIPEGVEGPVILCEDVQLALEKIAAAFRDRVKAPVIGVTGSVGKTTAKEFVSAVLSCHMPVHKTAGNLNNTIGVPLTLSGIGREHQAAVIEMGINHFGEMDHLGAMVKPDIMLYTRIGHAHLEFLGDLEGVFRAKTEVLKYMAEDALIIFNGDDPYQQPFRSRKRSLSYGTGENCDVRATDVVMEETGFLRCEIHYGSRTVHAVLNAFGEHMVYAALEGAAAGFALGLSDEEIEAGIASYAPVGRRFAVTDTGFVKLIDDCYNANPDSVKSSVKSLCDISGRHVCILGDMLELGADSPAMHEAVGSFVKEEGVDLLITCGALSNMHTAAGYGIGAVTYADKAEMISALPELLHPGDVILVKASLRSNFAEVSEAVRSLQLIS